MNLIISLGLVGINLALFGIGYAAYIYKSPFPPGWAWLSVLIGDAATDLGSAVAIALVLSFSERLELWYMALIPFAGHVITGLPMIWSQNRKRLEQHRTNHQIIEETNGKASKMAY